MIESTFEGRYSAGGGIVTKARYIELSGTILVLKDIESYEGIYYYDLDTVEIMETTLDRIEAKITTIDGNAFYQDSALQLNHLPNNLTYLGASAFQGCGDGLELTTLPDGLKKLYAYTFVNCKNVKITSFGSASSSGSQLPSYGQE